jgi:hypothetical protein
MRWCGKLRVVARGGGSSSGELDVMVGSSILCRGGGGGDHYGVRYDVQATV